MNNSERARLVSLIKQNSAPLSPLPMELPPEWEGLALHNSGASAGAHFRACLFDLYGTLFVSNAGEIAANTEGGAVSVPDPGTVSAYVRPPYGRKTLRPNPPPDAALPGLTAYFQSVAAASHARSKAAGTAFPEIRVEEIWAAYRGPLPAAWNGLPADGAARARETALRYELAVNPVYPMPDALETLNALRGRGVILGIISNAQFFSPLLFEAFFGKTPEELGFDPGLLVWSFELGEAKPSLRLFETAKIRLKELGVAESETLYAGNDMRNDIIPAARAGFTTALFAGDRRSLRLRDAVPEANKPAFTARDLSAVERILLYGADVR
jgi:putative hydrolase of the HAD superfamily